MIVQVDEQLRVFLKPLVEPGALVVVQRVALSDDVRFHLAHGSSVPVPRSLSGLDREARPRRAVPVPLASILVHILVHIWCT